MKESNRNEKNKDERPPRNVKKTWDNPQIRGKSVKQKPMTQGQPISVKQEQNSVKQEPMTQAQPKSVKQEPMHQGPVKQQQISVKQEQQKPVKQNPHPQSPTPTLSDLTMKSEDFNFQQQQSSTNFLHDSSSGGVEKPWEYSTTIERLNNMKLVRQQIIRNVLGWPDDTPVNIRMKLPDPIRQKINDLDEQVVDLIDLLSALDPDDDDYYEIKQQYDAIMNSKQPPHHFITPDYQQQKETRRSEAIKNNKLVGHSVNPKIDELFEKITTIENKLSLLNPDENEKQIQKLTKQLDQIVKPTPPTLLKITGDPESDGSQIELDFDT